MLPALAQNQPNDVRTFTVKGVSFKMVYVNGGTFSMGATKEQGIDSWDDEKPAHKVTVDGFYMAETEVTQGLWKAVMGAEPVRYGGWTENYGAGNDYPAYRVSYNDVMIFIEKLNSMSKNKFRLPTEAEWEYAARGGDRSKGYRYSGSNNLDDVAWYSVNSDDKTHPVKGKKPNELGLYDMSGNVWEWCSDFYGPYSDYDQTNPKGPDVGTDHVGRGGSWYNNRRDCRVTYRHYGTPKDWANILGFRLVLCP